MEDLRGPYFVRFMVGQKDVGMSALFLEEGQVSGGNLNYIFRGRFECGEGNTLKAKISATHYRGDLSLTLGTTEEISFELEGKYTSDYFDISGTATGNDELVLRAVGKAIFGNTAEKEPPAMLEVK